MSTEYQPPANIRIIPIRSSAGKDPAEQRREYLRTEAAAAARHLRAAVPPAFAECVERDPAKQRLRYPTEDVVRAAQAIFEGKILRVCIRGESSAGKTSGAGLLVGELARLVEQHFGSGQRETDPAGRNLSWWNRAVAWYSAHDLADEADYTDGRRDGIPEFSLRARNANILVLDDLGSEKGIYPGSNNAPVGILQKRYDAGLVTVTTDGLLRGQLEQRYGIGVARRMRSTDPRTMVIGLRKEETREQEVARLRREIEERQERLRALEGSTR